MSARPNITADEAKKLLEGSTPGPWQRWKKHLDVFAKVTKNTPGSIGGWQVCQIVWHRENPNDPDPAETDCGCDEEGCATCHPAEVADARLIAAAPDLAATVVAQAEELENLRAELARAQRIFDEALPREVIPCPNCGRNHVENARHDNPLVDGRKRPHHTHRCYHCSHVWDSGRWSFGVEPGHERGGVQ